MANIFFQGAVLSMSSGALGTVVAPIDRIQSVGINYQLARADVPVLGKFAPLNDRPVINYTPVQVSVDFIKSSKNMESNLGILNPTGFGTVLINSETIAGYGLRNLEVALASVQSTSYSNKIVLPSGALTSYSIQGSVGDSVKGSVSFECFDYIPTMDNSIKVAQNYSGELVKSENVSISGIVFSGFGLSGLMIQSFNLGVSIGRTASFRMGRKYPERPVSSLGATFQFNGFLDGLDNTSGSLSRFECGAPMTGSYFLTLQPSCSNQPATTYELKNPYLDSKSVSAAVGNYLTVDMSFSLPMSIISSEFANGSNLIIT